MSTSAQPAGTKAYIVQMEGMPVVTYEGGTIGLEATKPAKRDKINPKDASGVLGMTLLRVGTD